MGAEASNNDDAIMFGEPDEIDQEIASKHGLSKGAGGRKQRSPKVSVFKDVQKRRKNALNCVESRYD